MTDRWWLLIAALAIALALALTVRLIRGSDVLVGMLLDGGKA
jgi:hypothetical protein